MECIALSAFSGALMRPLEFKNRRYMELSIGQKVCYPGQGVCVVEELQQKSIGDCSMIFYSLRVLNDNSNILVPMANAENVGIRPLISQIQCKKLIERLASDFQFISSDWKTRSREFTEKLHSGDVFEAADVLKKLTFLSREKKLSFREQTLLEKAKFLIISEITYADGVAEETICRELEQLVNCACEKHVEVQPSVMATAVH